MTGGRQERHRPLLFLPETQGSDQARGDGSTEKFRRRSYTEGVRRGCLDDVSGKDTGEFKKKNPNSQKERHPTEKQQSGELQELMI